jgi:hypothetical protein
MPWKINVRGVFDYHEFDPEKIEEVDPPCLAAFGVRIASRYGQAHELASLLRFVRRLQHEQPATVLAMERVDWDSKGCSATVTMRDTAPQGWGELAAERLADIFWAVGGCSMLYVEKPDGTSWEFQAPEPEAPERIVFDLSGKGAS